jgi:t-SNARE complex subunit (syntaxin)
LREVDEGGEKRGNSVERWRSVEEVFVRFVVVVVVVVVVVIVVVVVVV